MDCFGPICFHSLNPQGAKIFGFAEFLAALALIVVAWTIADRRYVLHLQMARWPVRRIAFHTVAVVGVLALLTDVWRASALPVITGNILSPVAWQALLGFAFLAVFVIWIWTAFLYPPVFDRKNGTKFVELTYRIVAVGDSAELAHLAEALGPSAQNIVKMASTAPASPKATNDPAKLGNQLLQLMADPGFCHVIVRASPGTVHDIFLALRSSPSASSSVRLFARNVLTAAVNNQESFLHRERSDHRSGLAAQSQVITRCAYGDIDTLDRISRVFYQEAYDWRAANWDAFLRAAGQTFSSFSMRARPTRSQTIIDIFSTLEQGTRNLHRLNGISDTTARSDEADIARAILEFISEAAEAIQAGPVTIARWAQADWNPIQELARIACKILVDASFVTTPSSTNWWIQYNLAWSSIFDRHSSTHGAVFAEVRERVARMLWSQVRELDYSPGFVGGHVLGLCLNIGWVVGTSRQSTRDRSKPERALLWLTHRWARRRFAWLYKYDPKVATSGFSELMSYQPKRQTLRRMWEPIAGRPRAIYRSWEVESAPPGQAVKHLLPYAELPREYTSRIRRVPRHII